MLAHVSWEMIEEKPITKRLSQGLPVRCNAAAVKQYFSRIKLDKDWKAGSEDDFTKKDFLRIYQLQCGRWEELVASICTKIGLWWWWFFSGLRHGGEIVNKFSTEMDLTVEFEIYFSQLLDFISVWILFSSDIGAVCPAFTV